MGRVVILAVAVMVIAIVGFFNHDAYAVSFDIKDQSSCQSLPSGSPSWDSTTNTCTVQAISLTLNSTDSLTVENGITFAIDGTNDKAATVNNAGTINNFGTIALNFADATINNYGTINNLSGGTMTNYYGALSNYAGGIVNNKSGGSFYWGYPISNLGGTVNNWGLFAGGRDSNGNLYAGGMTSSGGTINNFAGGYIQIGGLNLGGTLNNFAGSIFYFESQGTTMRVGDTINNSGKMTFSIDPYCCGFGNWGGTINNLAGGTFTNYNGAIYSVGTITNAGAWTNYGTINMLGSFSGNPISGNAPITSLTLSPAINAKDSFCYKMDGGGYNIYTKSCTLQNDFTIGSGHTLSIPHGITLSSPVTVRSYGNLNNAGTFSESTTFINSGAINNTGGIINSKSSATLNNTGTISNSGGTLNNYNILNNPGTINNSGGILNNARSKSVINNPGVIYGCGGTFTNLGSLKVNPINYDSCTYMQDTTHSTGLSTYSGRQIQAEYVNSSSVLVGKQIDTISIELKRVGSPTGNVTIGVFNGDLSVKKLFASKDVSTLTTSYKNYTFSLPSSVPPYPIQAGDRIGIKFAGGNSTFYVAVMTDQNAADPFDGPNSYLTYYTTAWKSFTSNDLYMTLQRLH